MRNESLIRPRLMAAPIQHNTIGQQHGTQQFSFVARLTAMPCTTQKPQGRHTTAHATQMSCRQPHSGTVQLVRIWQLWARWVMEGNNDTLTRTIFEQASIGHFQLFLKALETGLVPPTLRDKDGSSLLHLAVWAGERQVVATVLQLYPVQLHLTNTAGATPLHLASVRGDIPLISTLIDSGSNLTTPDTRGADCILAATEVDQALSVLCLYWSGADLSSVDSNHCGIAHWAGYYDSWKVMQIAVTLSLDLQCKDNKGFTPLHRAAITDSVHSADALVRAHVDTSIRDSQGRTALDVAVAHSAWGVAAVIQRKTQWRLGPKTYYTYMLLTAWHYWVCVLPWTAHYLFLSLLLINSYFIAFLCFFSLPTATQLKLQSSDMDTLKSTFHARDFSNFPHNSDFCFICFRLKPPRTHHCLHCNHCVAGFDQHCHLLNVCIGERERGRFWIGLSCLVVTVGVLVYLDWVTGWWGEVLDWLALEGDLRRPWPSVFLSLLHLLSLWCLLWEWIFELRALLQGLSVYENLHKDSCPYLFSPSFHLSNPFNHGPFRNFLSFLTRLTI